jgi:hypothetical protein
VSVRIRRRGVRVCASCTCTCSVFIPPPMTTTTPCYRHSRFNPRPRTSGSRNLNEKGRGEHPFSPLRVCSESLLELLLSCYKHGAKRRDYAHSPHKACSAFRLLAQNKAQIVNCSTPHAGARSEEEGGAGCVVSGGHSPRVTGVSGLRLVKSAWSPLPTGSRARGSCTSSRSSPPPLQCVAPSPRLFRSRHTGSARCPTQDSPTGRTSGTGRGRLYILSLTPPPRCRPQGASSTYMSAQRPVSS